LPPATVGAMAWLPVSDRSSASAESVSDVPAALVDAASKPYRRAGRFAYHFARGKLRGDPVYEAILSRGLLQGRTLILDLGCGQGLLTAWLRAAEHSFAAGAWPAAWAGAPRGVCVRGIELMAQDVERARRALGPDLDIVRADICQADFDSADAVVILDVLHYLRPVSQQQVLQRARTALPRDGLLLVRVGDAGAGLRFRYGQWIDRITMLARGHGWAPMHWRSIGQWRQLLDDCDFDSEVLPMSRGTPFANALLIARAR